MTQPNNSSTDEVDQLLLNAELRDALEPYIDDSFELVSLSGMPTPKENEYLKSMLAWELAPVLPIGRWCEPELQLPPPDSLDDKQLHRLLWEAIHRLYEQRVVLEFTDHLSDRALYCLVVRDILPSLEKKVDLPKTFLRWHCFDDTDDPRTWLRYYATEEERQGWQEEQGGDLPPADPLPYPRRMPRRTL